MTLERLSPAGSKHNEDHFTQSVTHETFRDVNLTTPSFKSFGSNPSARCEDTP
jgi:hypothetical protein